MGSACSAGMKAPPPPDSCLGEVTWILGKSLKAVAVLQLHLLRPIRERVATAGEVVQGR